MLYSIVRQEPYLVYYYRLLAARPYYETSKETLRNDYFYTELRIALLYVRIIIDVDTNDYGLL